MKKIKFLSIAFLLGATLLYSCGKDTGKGGGSTTPSTTNAMVTATTEVKISYKNGPIAYDDWVYPWASNVSAVAKSTVISGPYIQILAINSNGSTMGLIFPAIVGNYNIAAANDTVLASYSNVFYSGRVVQFLPDTGTITVTSITTNHVKGAFSWGGNKTLTSTDSSVNITVSTGQFNLDYTK